MAKGKKAKDKADKSKTVKRSRMAPAAKSVENQVRRSVIETARAMSDLGLTPGLSGNVSCRFGKGMLITPSGLAYATLKPSDIAFVNHDGSFDEKRPKPSSEWRFHLSVYAARPDVGAVVHTHSMHATVLAAAHKPIPAFHYMVAVAGGNDIPLVPYAAFGTEELAAYVAAGVSEREACLMANHGQIAVGPTLTAALDMAAEVEELAEQYYKELAFDGVHLLDGEQMVDVLERFKSYRASAQKG